MRLPVVWTERHSPRSRFGRIRLDLFTTPYRLTAEAQAELREITPGAVISPHDGRWDRIPLRDLHLLAPAILRAATRSANLNLNRSYPASCPARVPGEVAAISERMAVAG